MSLQPNFEVLWIEQVLKNQVKPMLPSTLSTSLPSKGTKKHPKQLILKFAVKDASFFLYEIRHKPWFHGVSRHFPPLHGWSHVRMSFLSDILLSYIPLPYFHSGVYKHDVYGFFYIHFWNFLAIILPYYTNFFNYFTFIRDFAFKFFIYAFL